MSDSSTTTDDAEPTPPTAAGASYGVDDRLLDILHELKLPGVWHFDVGGETFVRMTPTTYQRGEPPTLSIYVDGSGEQTMWHLESPDVDIGEVLGADHVERDSLNDPYPEVAGHGGILNVQNAERARSAVRDAAHLLDKNARERAVRARISDESDELPAGIGHGTLELLAEQLESPNELDEISRDDVLDLDGVGATTADLLEEAGVIA